MRGKGRKGQLTNGNDKKTKDDQEVLSKTTSSRSRRQASGDEVIAPARVPRTLRLRRGGDLSPAEEQPTRMRKQLFQDEKDQEDNLTTKTRGRKRKNENSDVLSSRTTRTSLDEVSEIILTFILLQSLDTLFINSRTLLLKLKLYVSVNI